MVTQKNGKYANAKSIEDFKGAKITAQLNTFHYTVIDQIPDVQKQQASKRFFKHACGLVFRNIDGYVSERPEGVTASNVNKDFKMIEFADDKGFKTNPEDVQVAVGMRKGDSDVQKVNQILATISAKERTKLWMLRLKTNHLQLIENEDTGLIAISNKS